MREIVEIAASVEDARRSEGTESVRRRGRFSHENVGDLPAHSFPGRKELTTEDTGKHRENQNPHFSQNQGEVGHPQTIEPIAEDVSIPNWSWEDERARRVYRGPDSEDVAAVYAVLD